MFGNWFRSRSSRKTSFSNSFRPRLEVLEDRTVPDASGVPAFAALSGLEALSSNPALAQANALLNNQLSDQLLLLPNFNAASTSQLLSSIQSNPTMLGSLATVPNFVGETFALLGQQSALTADLAELVIDPSVSANPQFDQSVNNLADAIHENLVFSNPVAFVTTVLGGESMLNSLSGALANGGSANSLPSGFPYSFVFNPATLNVSATPLASAPATFSLGEGNQTLDYPALAADLTPFPLDTSAYGAFAGIPGSATGMGGMLALNGFGSFPLPFNPTLDQGFGLDGTINPTSGMT